MKRTALVIALSLSLTACSGLNVAWVLHATYNTPAATTTAVLAPGAAVAAAAPASAPASAASAAKAAP